MSVENARNSGVLFHGLVSQRLDEIAFGTGKDAMKKYEMIYDAVSKLQILVPGMSMKDIRNAVKANGHLLDHSTRRAILYDSLTAKYIEGTLNSTLRDKKTSFFLRLSPEDRNRILERAKTYRHHRGVSPCYEIWKMFLDMRREDLWSHSQPIYNRISLYQSKCDGPVFKSRL